MSEDWEALVAEVCAWRDFVDAQAASWMAPIIRRQHGSSEPWRVAVAELMTAGGAMTPDEAVALGLHKRARIGWMFWRALTVRGRADPAHAAECVVIECLKRARTREIVEEFKASGHFVEVYMAPVEDSRTCEAAMKERHKVFALADIPSLPLPKCDADYCRCTFIGYRNRRGRVTSSVVR